MTDLHNDLMERALRVAAVAHRHQVRKAVDLPYVTHSFAVVLILMRAGFDDPEVLAAAVLHDVVEDTTVTSAELRLQFPDRVIDVVDAVSELKVHTDGSRVHWKERKNEHIARMSKAGEEACAVCLADKLHTKRFLCTCW